MREFKVSKLLPSILFCMGSMLASQVYAGGCEGQKYCLANPVSDEYIAPWNIDVNPFGDGLPKGSGSAFQGKRIFNEKCALCHGQNGTGGVKMASELSPLPRLVNTAALPSKSIGSYWPYASTLFDYIQRAMPFYQPKSLKPDDVYSLVAFLLSENKIISQDMVVSQNNLAQIKMPNRDGFVCDNRPDTYNTACMKDCPVPGDKNYDAGKPAVTHKHFSRDCMILPVR